MRLLKSSLLAVVALPLLLQAGVQDSAKLRFNVAADQKVTMTVISDTKTTLSGMMEEESVTKTSVTTTYSFGKKTDDGWMAYSTENSDVKYESSSDAMGGMGDPAGSLKAMKSSGEVSDRGATRNMKVEGVDEMMAMFSEMDPSTKAGIFGVVYPENEIKVGSAWEHPVKMQGMVTGEIPFKYEVLSFEDLDGKKAAKLKVSSTGKLQIDLSSLGAGAGNVTASIDGFLWVDLATGVGLKSEMNMGQVMEIPGMITVNSKGTVKTTAKVN